MCCVLISFVLLLLLLSPSSSSFHFIAYVSSLLYLYPSIALNIVTLFQPNLVHTLVMCFVFNIYNFFCIPILSYFQAYMCMVSLYLSVFISLYSIRRISFRVFRFSDCGDFFHHYLFLLLLLLYLPLILFKYNSIHNPGKAIDSCCFLVANADFPDFQMCETTTSLRYHERLAIIHAVGWLPHRF
jgi:hypothetical protein